MGGQVVDYGSEGVASNPLLATYYGGIDAIAKYYESLMYNDIEAKLGADVWAKWDIYWSLPAGKERNAFYKQNPELGKYSDLRDEWRSRIDVATLKMESYLPEAKPAQIRPDAGELTSYQQEFAQALQPPQIDLEQVFQELGAETSNLLYDFMYYQQAMPNSARGRIEDVANGYGISYYELLSLIQQGLMQPLGTP